MIVLASLRDVLPGVDDFIAKLFPSWQALVIQLVATFILFFFMAKFLFKPVRKILKQRQDYIEKNIEDSKVELLEAKDKNKEAEENIISSQKQAQEIIASARKESEDIKEKSLRETDEEISKRRLALEKEIELEKIKSNEEIRASMIDVAIAASSKVLEREISKEDNARLIEDFIKEVSADE